MKFEPFSRKIEAVLGGNNTYIIPNFQRDYSWDKKNYDDFINDLLSVNEASYSTDTQTFSNAPGKDNDYFFGTILIVGEENKAGISNPYKVIDGQQRLTTMTLFFVAIKNIIENFKEDYQHNFTKALIITSSVKGVSTEYARLQNKSLNPILPVNVLNINGHKDNGTTHKALNRSQEWLLEAYDIILGILDKTSLAKRLSQSNKKKDFDKISEENYIFFLENLGDQILNSTVISIYSATEDQANTLYRNFNYRGIPLSQSDLIKNELLSLLDDSSESAVTSWKELENNIFSVDESINTFLFHYMISKYPSVTKNSLFKIFSKQIKPTATNYTSFLNETVKYSHYYKTIIHPTDDQKLFNKDNFFKKDSNPLLKRQLIFLDVIETTQVRIILLGLFYSMDNNIITSTQFRKIINIITEHQALHVLASTPPNKLTQVYKKYAKTFRTVEKNKVNSEISNLLKDLKNILPSENTVIKKADLYYDHSIPMNKMNSTQKKNKFMIHHILSSLSCNEQSKGTVSGNDGYKFIYDSSLEHIIDQKEDSIENIMNLGNILLLEQRFHSNTTDKKKMYSLSEITSTNKFFDSHQSFNTQQDITNRNSAILKQYTRFVKNLK